MLCLKNLDQEKIKPDNKSVLIVIDMQNCFVVNGTLPVPKGEEIVPLVNKIANAFENVVLTQDWHTANHISFSSSHPGKQPFETTTLPYGQQVLWPDHCVQGRDGNGPGRTGLTEGRTGQKLCEIGPSIQKKEENRLFDKFLYKILFSQLKISRFLK